MTTVAVLCCFSVAGNRSRPPSIENGPYLLGPADKKRPKFKSNPRWAQTIKPHLTAASQETGNVSPQLMNSQSFTQKLVVQLGHDAFHHPVQQQPWRRLSSQPLLLRCCVINKMVNKWDRRLSHSPFLLMNTDGGSSGSGWNN